ncbi:GNAT family N-acetyltransferase, partial [Aeromicrobium sp.]|uniref:GNAT family N-acetyltransferase n=1 Tax=Aeromicrobium sp. TaxID=1871063 RepID=UPI003C41567A
ISVDDLTRITSRGWPAIDSKQLGDWELRASRGFTGRANSVAVHGSPGLPMDRALERVREFYAAHGIPALAQLVIGSSAEREFVDAGWVPRSAHHGGAVVQVADLDPVYPRDPEAVVHDAVDDQWLARYGRADLDPETARTILQKPRTVGFVSIGTPVLAIARIVVTGEWAGISAVEVEPDARGQGLGRRAVDASLAWAVEHGADKAYLQTMRSNAAALALYGPYGFVDHHDYRYLEAPPG